MSTLPELIAQGDLAQQAADKLPTHPLLGRWIACPCGSPSCDYVSPSRIGTFYLGSGFTHAEAVELVVNMLKPRGGKKK